MDSGDSGPAYTRDRQTTRRACKKTTDYYRHQRYRAKQFTVDKRCRHFRNTRLRNSGSIGTEFCHRNRAQFAGSPYAGDRGQNAWRKPDKSNGNACLPALSDQRCQGRTNRRGGKKRSCGRLRHRRRTAIGRKRSRRPYHARACRNDAPWHGSRRSYRNAYGIIGAWRSGSHLLQFSIAQYVAWRSARPGPRAERDSGRTHKRNRGYLYGLGCRYIGEKTQGRYAHCCRRRCRTERSCRYRKRDCRPSCTSFERRIMAYWLMKSEPDAYSWAQLVKDERTGWSGVRNFQANNNMKAMKIGDQAFFYHSNIGRAIVGIMKIVKEWSPDPSDKSGRFGMVDVAPVRALKKPVTLAEIKAEPALAQMTLLRQGRLSVSAVTEDQGQRMQQLS